MWGDKLQDRQASEFSGIEPRTCAYDRLGANYAQRIFGVNRTWPGVSFTRAVRIMDSLTKVCECGMSGVGARMTGKRATMAGEAATALLSVGSSRDCRGILISTFQGRAGSRRLIRRCGWRARSGALSDDGERRGNGFASVESSRRALQDHTSSPSHSPDSLGTQPCGLVCYHDTSLFLRLLFGPYSQFQKLF